MKKIVLIALIFGVAGCGATRTITDTTTVTETSTSTLVRHARAAVRTVTSTSTAAAPAPAPSSSSLSWSGNGGQTLGTVNVPQDSTIKWTNDGQLFTLLDSENAVEVNSQAGSGQSAITAGTYHDVKVNALGNWTIKIVPQ